MCTACPMSVEGRPLSYARGPTGLYALHHALVTVYVGEAGALEHSLTTFTFSSRLRSKLTTRGLRSSRKREWRER